MKIHHTLGWMGLAALLLSSHGSWANAQTPPSEQASAGKQRKARSGKPPADKGPAETRQERDKRLLRECRGKPNAGACEGYAR